MKKSKIKEYIDLVSILLILIFSTLLIPTYNVNSRSMLDRPGKEVQYDKFLQFTPIWNVGITALMPVPPDSPDFTTKYIKKMEVTIEFDIKLYMLFILPLVIILFYKPNRYKN